MNSSHIRPVIVLLYDEIDLQCAIVPGMWRQTLPCTVL